MSETTHEESPESKSEKQYDQEQAHEAYLRFGELLPSSSSNNIIAKDFFVDNVYHIELCRNNAGAEVGDVFLVMVWWDDTGSRVPVRVETVFALEIGADDKKLSSFMFADTIRPGLEAKMTELQEQQYEMPQFDRAYKRGMLEKASQDHIVRKRQNVIELLGMDEGAVASYDDAKALIGLLSYTKTSIEMNARYTSL